MNMGVAMDHLLLLLRLPRKHHLALHSLLQFMQLLHCPCLLLLLPLGFPPLLFQLLLRLYLLRLSCLRNLICPFHLHLCFPHPKAHPQLRLSLCWRNAVLRAVAFFCL